MEPRILNFVEAMTLASLIVIPENKNVVVDSFEAFLTASLEFSEAQWEKIVNFLDTIGLSQSTPEGTVTILWNLLAINGVDSLIMAYTKLVKHE